jgi:S-(hydroxymethyl)glutathione dehydrogenase / alcohol dehydrogenase
MKKPDYINAAILVEQNKPLVIGKIKPPAALEPGQVLVKLHASGICGSQLGEIDGAKGPDKFLPHLLGHEGTGTVIEIGAGVRHVKPEDMVVLHWRKGQGMECTPPKYDWDGKTVNAGWVTTFNDYAIVAENRLTVIPKGSDPAIGALFGCAVTTGFGVVVNNAQIKIGESVVVFGAGGIGLNIVQAAKMVSAYPIIAVDVFDGRLDLARDMGATHTINAKTQNAAEEIKKILGPQKLDVFIDNTGKPDIIRTGYDLTHAQGRVILVGVPKSGDETAFFTLPLHFGKVITGSHGGETVPEIDIPRYHHLYEKGQIRLKELITHRIKLPEINDAIIAMRNGSISGRVIIEFD